MIEVRELRRAFGGVVALDGVSLNVPDGERRAVIGPNGAGKTTLINVLAGEISPTGGAGTLGGPIAGSALVSLIERVLPSLLPPELRISEAILGIVFIAFVLFARQGMVGLGRQTWLRVRSR